MKSKTRDAIIREPQVMDEMKRIAADPEGIKIMRDKAVFRLIRLTNVKPALANIIKEDMLSAGGEAAIHRLSCACKVETTDVLVMGTIAQYKHLLHNLWRQPYGGRKIIARISKLLKI